VIACLEDPALIEKIRTHLSEQGTRQQMDRLPERRAPPVSRFA